MPKYPTVTLSQNRSTGPKRTVKIIMYRRDLGPGRVVPYVATMDEAGRTNVEQTTFAKIRGSNPDPEFAVAWSEHVRYQAALARDERPTAAFKQSVGSMSRIR